MRTTLSSGGESNKDVYDDDDDERSVLLEVEAVVQKISLWQVWYAFLSNTYNHCLFEVVVV